MRIQIWVRPAALALATIACPSPPSVDFRIQIHMPLPEMIAVTGTLGDAAGVGGSSVPGTSVPGCDGGAQCTHGGGGGGGGQPAIGTGPAGITTAGRVVGGVVVGAAEVVARGGRVVRSGSPAASGVACRGPDDPLLALLNAAAVTPPTRTSATTTASQRAWAMRHRSRSWSYGRSTSSRSRSGSPPRSSVPATSAGQTRRRGPIGPLRDRYAVRGLRHTPDVGGLQALRPLAHVKLDLLVLLQVAVARFLDRAVVHEHIWATILGDEAVPLFGVEPLHRSSCHKQSLLSWPARTSTCPSAFGSGEPTRELLEATTSCDAAPSGRRKVAGFPHRAGFCRGMPSTGFRPGPPAVNQPGG